MIENKIRTKEIKKGELIPLYSAYTREEARADGLKQGIETRNKEIAKSLKEMRLSISDIMKVTFLPKNEIEKL